ncbi:Fibrinogen C domain-containing protein 1 [Holothuria leucospilota]|uniref:Fibrinogen C domain-containing protein 1 n=1 Tax=Holothuria leucospilota TaxID=206669 RepID=A0A9Q1CT61_HOLLE|nr:Fibrinogen C domain-containing protein 1 [Holothuria leucospilota]
MDILIQFKTVSVFAFMCICCFGKSSAQTNSRNQYNREEYSQGKDDVTLGSPYFVYQAPGYRRDCQEVHGHCSSSSDVYLIKPDGYPEPFEVFCDNATSGGGWTVIYRLISGSLDLRRTWDDYKKGFGFLSSEYWIGNERLSFLTNQNNYEVRIDATVSNGSSFYIKYDSFRISDEWSNFTLTTVGSYKGNAGSVIDPCWPDTVYGNCTCMDKCEDPDIDELCVCPTGFLMKEGTCVLPAECGCYISEENRYITDGEIYVDENCTTKCSCNGYHLTCEDYECSENAACKFKNTLWQCYCNDGYNGDGETCMAIKDCNDVRAANNTQDGVYTIMPSEWPYSPFEVFCNMTVDGGNWTVFQRRNRGATGFYNNWISYKNGFGDIQDEFWLGNDKLHYLTKQGTYELRVDFVTPSMETKYAKYTSFKIDSVTNKYRVTDIGTYSGNGGDGMSDVQNIQFSTHDEDHDGLSYDCAEGHRGGWWYGGGYYYHYYRYCDLWIDGSYNRRCTVSSLNGDYNGGSGQNIFWHLSYNGCYAKYTEMKIRRIS